MISPLKVADEQLLKAVRDAQKEGFKLFCLNCYSGHNEPNCSKCENNLVDKVNDHNTKRFTVWENEGSFFTEFLIHDRLTNNHYSLNKKVPRKIQKLFAEELLNSKECNPHEVRVLIEFIIHS